MPEPRGIEAVKAVMYHYVRPRAAGLPHFPFLRLADFERQLDDFARDYGFVDREGFRLWGEGGPAPKGVLLTFDDGLRDHLDFVLPVLKARGLFGLFYVSSGPPSTGRILDVHKVHLALGRLGGPTALDWLKSELPDLLPPGGANGSTASPYAHQTADQATKTLKQLFNWQLTGEERAEVLDRLLDHAFAGAPPRWQDFYLDERGVRALSDAGMGVGPHSHTHELSIRLSPDRLRYEVLLSSAFVELHGGSRDWGYCYPYGARSAFSEETEKAVAEAGCPFAFAFDARDITTPLAETERFALPRHNCNSFPHGAVSYGNGAAS
jgi:peptidoglycan/xylan/chitin deacetylase (PgdA/CDA1 family)